MTAPSEPHPHHSEAMSRASIAPVPGKWRAAALYTVLTLLLAYPLSVTAHRTLPADDPDGHLFMWTLAWNTYAFTHQPFSMFDANIFYPLHNSLAYSENLIGSAFFAAPVLWATGNPVLAVNVVSLLSCILCGLGAYVLGRRLGMGAAAAVVTGLIFAFSPPRFLRFSQIHLTVVQWIPFALASLHAYLEGGRRRDLLLATAFTTLQVLSTGHGGVFLAVAIVLLLAYRVVLGEPLLIARRLRDFGIAGALLLLPNVFFMIPYQLAQREMGLRRSLRSWNTSIESFFASPTRVDVFLQSLVTDRDINGAASAWLFPGVLPIGLAIVAVLAAWSSFRLQTRAPRPPAEPAAKVVTTASYRLPLRIVVAAVSSVALLAVVRPALHAGEGLATERYADGKVVQTGYLTIGQSGLYNFGMTADELSRLTIDSQLVIDHGRDRPDTPRTGSARLSEGSHRLLMEHVLLEGQPALEWTWERDGGPTGYRPVPSWVLSRRPVSYSTAVAARVVDWLRVGAVLMAALGAAWCVYVWIARRRDIWTAWGEPYRRSATAFYLLLAALCIALALGPPYGLWQFVYWMPGFNFIRASSRFMVLGLLAVAVLSGFGFDRLTARLSPARRRLAGVVVGGLLIGEFSLIPYKGVPYQYEVPAVDQWVARQPKPFSVAEVPVTWSARYHSNYMLHSMAHWQKTVHGYSGLQPALHLELYDQLKIFPTEESLQNLAQLGVTYVIVHASWFRPADRSVLEERLEAFDAWLKLEYMDPDSRVYTIRRPAAAASNSAGGP